MPAETAQCLKQASMLLDGANYAVASLVLLAGMEAAMHHKHPLHVHLGPGWHSGASSHQPFEAC